MRILVYGAGAVGQGIGGMLAANGHEVDLLLRERYATAIREHGLAVSGIFGDRQVPPGKLGLFTTLSSAAGRGHDYILVTVKSYNTTDAATDLGDADLGDANIVSVQNGCGNVETLTAALGEERVLAGRVITGFEIEKPGLVRITVSADDIHIGGTCEGVIPLEAERLATAVREAGIPCIASPFLARDLYAKLLYNCALNPLGAVLGVRYGALGDSPHACAVMDAVIAEVFAVLGAQGASTHWENPDDYRAYFYAHQIPATYNHRPSMLQDIEQGKRTEVEAMTGYVTVQGERFGVPTPVCAMLSSLVRFKEAEMTGLSPKRPE